MPYFFDAPDPLVDAVRQRSYSLTACPRWLRGGGYLGKVFRIRKGHNMAWSFRRSISLGPFRINFSKSGISYSFGLGGFRTGVDAKGKRYSSMSIPGTGIRYQKSHGTSKKKKAEVDATEEE